MKKFKLFNILLILAMIFCMPIAYAHDIELDEDNIVTIPLDKNNQLSSSTKVEVDESFGEYKLYYQYVRFEGSEYESFLNIHEEELQYVSENEPDEDATDTEKEEYAEAIADYEASKKALKPGYVEANWQPSKNGTVPFVKKSGEEVKENDAYILWVKVTNEDGSEEVYDELWVLYNEGMELDEEKSAQTSDNIMIVGVLIAAFAGVMVLSYKKSRA